MTRKIGNIAWLDILQLVPLISLCLFVLYQSLSFPLHDFSNSYFPARLVTERIAPELKVFDIFQFNSYAWDSGYPEVLIDFYLNSPFTSTVFYPFAWIDNAYVSKHLFNVLSIILLNIGIYRISKKHRIKAAWLMILPLVFFVPIRNHILFGQSYFLVLFLIVYSFSSFEKNENNWGALCLSLAGLIKVFPIIYGVSLLFNKNWKAIGSGILLTTGLILLSSYTTSLSFWSKYLFEIFPNAIANESTVNFQSNAQSITVFLKTLFVSDEYYNPKAFLDNPQLYYIFVWIIKSFIIAIAVQWSLKYRNQLFYLLAIWVVALFLLQSRTATYAQILWIIPWLLILHHQCSIKLKLSFTFLLFFVCNFPFGWLSDFSIALVFLRMWMSIGLSIIFSYSLNIRWDYRYFLVVLLAIIPFNRKAFFKAAETQNTQYVIDKKNHFIIYDFKNNNGYLSYDALGINGKESINTDIVVHSFDSLKCSIKNNQIYYGNKQMTHNNALKLKPVLINQSSIYYLSDHHGRRAAYTLKRIVLK